MCRFQYSQSHERRSRAKSMATVPEMPKSKDKPDKYREEVNARLDRIERAVESLADLVARNSKTPQP